MIFVFFKISKIKPIQSGILSSKPFVIFRGILTTNKIQILQHVNQFNWKKTIEQFKNCNKKITVDLRNFINKVTL